MPLRLINIHVRKLLGITVVAGVFIALFSMIVSYHEKTVYATTHSSSSTFASSNSAFVLPEHTYYVSVTTVGGGGAGGGAYARGYDGITSLTAGIASAAAGGGGGGGQNSAVIVNGTNAMQNNHTINVTVGAASSGGTIGNPGNNSCSSSTAPAGNLSKVAWNGSDYAIANGGGGGTSAACNSNTGVGANNKQYLIGGGGGEGTPNTANGDGGGAGIHADWAGAQGGQGGLGPFSGYSRAPVSGDCAQSSGCTYQGSDATCVGCGGGGAAATQFDANSGVSSRGGNGYRGEVTVNYSWFVSDVTFDSIVDDYDYNSGGKSVVISGTNFSQLVPGSVVVNFCGNNGTVTNVNTSTNTITVTVPSGSTGNCDVIIYYTDSVYGFTDWSNATSPLIFTYIYDFIGISVSNSSLSLGSISPSDSVRDRSGFVTVTSSTNRPTGYRTTVKSTDTMLTCSTATMPPVPSIASTGSLSGTEWGWNYSDTLTSSMSSFRPASTSEVQIDTAAAATSQSVRFWAGARIDREIAACNAYSQLVTFTIYGL